MHVVFIYVLYVIYTVIFINILAYFKFIIITFNKYKIPYIVQFTTLIIFNLIKI